MGKAVNNNIVVETEKEWVAVYDYTRMEHLQLYPPNVAARLTGCVTLGVVTAYDRKHATEKARLMTDITDKIRELMSRQ